MTHRSKNIIGTRVKQARLSTKPPLTQDELSGRIAIHSVKLDRSAIANIEVGIRLVTDFELLALAKALNVDIHWLLDGKR